MLSCREVSRAVAAGELEGASAWRLLQVRLHLLMCRHCRRYAAQIAALGRVARELLGRSPGEDETVERLRASILERSRATEED